MSELGPDFDREARRLSWEISPDLAVAQRAVELRAARLAAARHRRRSSRSRVGLVATLVVAMTVSASSLLATRIGANGHTDAGTSTELSPPVGAGADNSVFPAGSTESFIDVPEVRVTTAVPASGARQVLPCSRADVTLETEFGREVYPPGDVALVTLVLRNASRTACRAQADRCTSRISVFSAGGVGIYSSVAGAHPYLCQTPDRPGPAQPVLQLLQPGQGMTMTFRWLEQSCSGAALGPGCAAAVPGRYTVTGEWAGFPTSGSVPAVLSPDYRLMTLPRHVIIA